MEIKNITIDAIKQLRNYCLPKHQDWYDEDGWPKFVKHVQDNFLFNSIIGTNRRIGYDGEKYIVSVEGDIITGVGAILGGHDPKYIKEYDAVLVHGTYRAILFNAKDMEVVGDSWADYDDDEDDDDDDDDCDCPCMRCHCCKTS